MRLRRHPSRKRPSRLRLKPLCSLTQSRPDVEVVGISGDIKEFYNVFKLDLDFWHLKLFLLKEELKADTHLLIDVINTLINSNKSWLIR